MIMLVALVALVVACSQNAIGPDPYARKHAIVTNVVTCANPTQRNLQVSWVSWQWSAIFLKGAQQVSVVTDSTRTKSSGCVYAVGDQARVKLVPLNGIDAYLDSAFVDVQIK
jgi:hypothetical protein